MIAEEEKEPLREIELAHQPKDVAVRASDLCKLRVLPQLVAVPHLDVGEPPLVVVLQRVEEEQLIVGKIIGPAVIAPVTIAEEDQLIVIAKRHDGRRVKDLV